MISGPVGWALIIVGLAVYALGSWLERRRIRRERDQLRAYIDAVRAQLEERQNRGRD